MTELPRVPAVLDGRLLHTISHAAQRLSVSDRTIKRLIEDGELRIVHIRSATRIPEWEIERYARAEWAAENGLDVGGRPTPRGNGRRPPRRVIAVPKRA